ncbi:MAG: sugar phosphate isomerase/epimerase [Clostridia bacterium]|nr:sugar phosphate isomerase/epimerase [Clostridia bacterium]
MFSRISFYSRPFPKVTNYKEMIDLAAEYGMTGLEGYCQYEFEKPDIEIAKEMRAYAEERGIKFCCFSIFLNLVGDDSEAQMERLKKYAEFAAALGSPYLHHTVINEIYNPENVLPRREELFYKGIAAAREIFDYAEKLGVRCIVEDQGFIYNGVEGFGRFLHEVERDIGIVADFGNIRQVEEKVADLIYKYPEKIAHVHVKDVYVLPEQKGGGLPTINGNFMYGTFFGEGDAGFDDAMKALHDIGYKGYYSLEFGVRDDASPLLDKAMRMVAERI